MKKVLISSLFILLFWGCDDHKPFDKSLLATTVPECAYLEEEVAKKWIEEYKNCNESGKCEEPSKIDFNYPVTKEIITLLRKANLNINKTSYVSAVYENENVYACRVCKGDESNPACKVTGHSTFILKIEIEGHKDLYIDLVTICPPPLGCDTEDKASSPDSTKAKSAADTAAKKGQ